MTGKRLPYDAEIEYLESTGTQWIDTGIIPQDNTVIDFKCKPFVPPSTETISSGCIFGVHRLGETTQLNGSYAVFFKGYQTSSGISCGITFTGGVGTRSQSLVVPRPVIQSLTSVILKANQVEINGTSYNFTTSTVLPLDIKQSLPLFASKNGNGQVDTHAQGLKLISFCMSNGETTVYDTIPVRVGQVGCMYDKVSGQLFGNRGTGDFILGPDK